MNIFFPIRADPRRPRHTTPSSTARRAVIATVLALALLLGTRGVLYAHTMLLRSTPAAGSHLAVSPARVSLLFSEPIEAGLTHMTLISATGDSISLRAAGDPHDVHAIIAPIDAPLVAGAWRIVWHVVSADGHPVKGRLAFTVGASVPVATAPSATAPVASSPAATDSALDAAESESATWGPTAAGAPVLPALLRGLALFTLMAGAGLLGFASTSTSALSPQANRVALWLVAAAPLLLALHAAAWVMNATPDHQFSASALASDTGRVELWRTALALLALWALALARRPRVALGFAIAALVVSGASGHSAALSPLWTMPAKALHLLAGAAWVGGVLWLLTRTRGNADDDRRELSRVSGIALAAVIVVALSGLVQAFTFLATPLDLVRTSYGALVLVKIAGLVALAGFGAHHRRRSIPRLPGAAAVAARFHLMLRYEVVVMALTILIGGLLAYVPPRADAPAASPPRTVTDS